MRHFPGKEELEAREYTTDVFVEDGCEVSADTVKGLVEEIRREQNLRLGVLKGIYVVQEATFQEHPWDSDDLNAKRFGQVSRADYHGESFVWEDNRGRLHGIIALPERNAAYKHIVAHEMGHIEDHTIRGIFKAGEPHKFFLSSVTDGIFGEYTAGSYARPYISEEDALGAIHSSLGKWCRAVAALHSTVLDKTSTDWISALFSYAAAVGLLLAETEGFPRTLLDTNGPSWLFFRQPQLDESLRKKLRQVWANQRKGQHVSVDALVPLAAEVIKSLIEDAGALAKTGKEWSKESLMRWWAIFEQSGYSFYKNPEPQLHRQCQPPEASKELKATIRYLAKQRGVRTSCEKHDPA